ncbi:MAG: dephospho-CoA kinase [Nitrospirota bacterium]|nr:dephospho-CoA kinase [Nitrospirota bacterium]
MVVIGLTGGVATGKSTVAKGFEALGVPVLDADGLAHLAIEPSQGAYDRLVEAFGSGILTDSDRIDRRKLRELLVSDPQAKKQIEAIVHPEVLRLGLKKMEKFERKGARWLLFEVPLLFETGLEKTLSPVIVVYCPRSVQVERLILRDKMALEDALGLLEAQKDIEEKRKLADFVLDNTGPFHALQPQIGTLYETLKGRYGDPWPR